MPLKFREGFYDGEGIQVRTILYNKTHGMLMSEHVARSWGHRQLAAQKRPEKTRKSLSFHPKNHTVTIA